MSLFNAHGHFVPLAQFRAALAKGANPNQLWISPRGSADYTIRVPVIVAAQSQGGLPFLLALLDDPRTDIEARNLEGRSALMMAASHGLEPHAALLLSRGANLHAKDTYGRTALHHAAQSEDEAMLRLLLEAGANPNDTNQAGRAALHEVMMAYTRFPQPLETKIRLLLDYGAHVDHRGAMGMTPLYSAAGSGWSRIVAVLLSAGANPHLRADCGLTAMELVLKRLATFPGVHEPGLTATLAVLEAHARRGALACLAQMEHRMGSLQRAL